MDHFKDCKPGDLVTVTLRGSYQPQEMGVKAWVGHYGIVRDDSAIISVTIESRPLAVGDRVRWRGFDGGTICIGPWPTGVIRGVDGNEAWVKWTEGFGPSPTMALSKLERVDD